MSDEFTERLVKQLSIEESVRPRIYLDSKGIPTIGVGRNLRDKGLSHDEIELLLANDIADNVKFLNQFAWYRTANPVRQAALVDLCFMGPEKLLHFVHMIAALDRKDFESAKNEIITSEWYKDVGPTRGNRIARMIATGAWPPDIPWKGGLN